METSELVASIKSSSVVAIIAGPNAHDPCPTQSLQLGLAIMFDKPIILLVMRGRAVPEKIVSISDRIVEVDTFAAEETVYRIQEAMREMAILK